MSRTVDDVLADVASRRYEDSNPTDPNETTRRLNYLNQAYRYVLNKNLWWFTAVYSSDTPVANKKTYQLPTDFKSMIDVRINGDLYSPLLDTQGFDFIEEPITLNIHDDQYFIYNDEITFIPQISSSDVPSSLTTDSITLSSGLATVTTSTAHGYIPNDFVSISGANQTEYNSTFRIVSVPSTTTFTITVTGSPASPATGTISVIKRPIVYHYYSYGSQLTSGTDTFLIPDQYTDCLSAYVAGRIFQIEGARGKAGDSFDEVNEIMKMMTSDQMSRNLLYKPILPNAYNLENYRY